MAVQQYLRKASLIVGADEGEARDLSDLRFRFEIRRGDIQTPNSCDIRVYNVAPATAQSIQQEFTRVVIQAGYEGNFGIIFDGQIKQVRRGRESETETYLDITAADGDSAYNFAISAISLAAGSTPPDQISAILQGMAQFGISQGYLPEELPGNPLPRGKVIFGMARDELRKIALNTSTQWSIQDGKYQAVPETAYIPGDIPVITRATGMIGLPEQTQNGIKVRMLLNPFIKIGQAIQLDNASIQRLRYGLALQDQPVNEFLDTQAIKLNSDGFYYVMIAEHLGDTRGEAWYTDVICLSIDATIPQGFIPRQGVNGDVGSIKRYG